MKKSSLKWFSSEVLRARHRGFISNDKFNYLLECAKELHKDEIIHAFQSGSDNGVTMRSIEEAEEFYNETFKSE